jgi:hypothetical protein
LASLGVSSVGGAFAAEWALAHDWSLFSRFLLLGGVGAITSDYPDIRHYNIGFGSSARLWVELRSAQWGELYAKVDRYLVHTWSGASGNEVAGVLDVGATFAATRQLGIGFHYLLADKSGHYERLADTFQTIHLGEGYVAWRF